MRTALDIVIAASSAIVLASCSRGEAPVYDVEALTRDIQGKEPDEVRSIIVRRFGPPARDIGSGLRIEQWDVAGGVLTFHPLSGPDFAKDGVSTRLIRTTNLAEDCLFGSYEMMTLPDVANHGARYWLGNVTLSVDGRYRYEDSGQNSAHREDQGDNFFMLYPGGTARVEYADGVAPRTRLEDVATDMRIATVTFTAQDGRTSRAYDIVAYRSRMLLTVESAEPMPFQMHKYWVNYWQ
jgi:hypothetical protein